MPSPEIIQAARQIDRQAHWLLNDIIGKATDALPHEVTITLGGTPDDSASLKPQQIEVKFSAGAGNSVQLPSQQLADFLSNHGIDAHYVPDPSRITAGTTAITFDDKLIANLQSAAPVSDAALALLQLLHQHVNETKKFPADFLNIAAATYPWVRASDNSHPNLARYGSSFGVYRRAMDELAAKDLISTQTPELSGQPTTTYTNDNGAACIAKLPADWKPEIPLAYRVRQPARAYGHGFE